MVAHFESPLEYFALSGVIMPLTTDSRETVPDEPDQALTVRDVALMLNVNEKTVYRLAQKRELPGFKIAGSWRFMRRDINC